MKKLSIMCQHQPKSLKKRGKKCIFNVTFDEMSIKNVVFIVQRLTSSKVWLIQVVSLRNGKKTATNWLSPIGLYDGQLKTPVLFYLTGSLSGLEKSVLLKDLLIKLHVKEINVVCVTLLHLVVSKSLTKRYVNYQELILMLVMKKSLSLILTIHLLKNVCIF